MLRQCAFLDKLLQRGRRRAMVVLVVTGVGLAGSSPGQTFTEFALPAPSGSLGGPLDITAGPDGNLWFTTEDFSVGGASIGKIGRITTAGVITEFALPTASSASAITAGPDGNLWFNENVNKIGRITTAGVITEFELPTIGSTLWGITAGPDANLWFTYTIRLPGVGTPLVGKIGRITAAGVIAEFAIPFEGAPFGITAGPDGNLWFTYSGVNGSGGIGRITTAGEVSGAFQIAACGSSPIDIVAGPDGNLWFTDAFGKIGRLDPRLVNQFPVPVITEFTVPPASLITDFRIPSGSQPWSIASGADGNLWFTDRFNGKIGRITTAGVITELAPPTLFNPTAITAGPDGDLWFTELFANRIGRITALSATCTPSGTNLCLDNARFRVEAAWTASDGTGGSGQAVAVTPNSGYFWFYSPSNVEIVVKALDGCSINNHIWLFAGGMTNVNVVLKVTDARTGQVKTYTSSSGTAFQPIQDTGAFSCP